MLPITLHAKPDYFDADVRQPCLRYLERHPDVKASKLPAYWQGKALSHLKQLYNNICSCTCFYIDPGTSYATVDHLVPKSYNKPLAYEWSNVRLASIIANKNKGESRGVCDPANIGQDWFAIDFTTMMIQVGDVLSHDVEIVLKTISREGIDLNHPDFLATRVLVWDWYQTGVVGADFLQTCYPHVFSKAERQGKL